MTTATLTIIETITSHVRGGGCGAAAWVARITGPDPKFGLAREFIQKDSHLSRSGKSGYIDFHITEPGIYEMRGVQPQAGDASIGSTLCGFIRVTEDGVETITKSEARAAFA